MEKIFDEYVNNYDLKDYNINYKFKHSYRVKELCDVIAQSLKLNDEDVFLANLIGLFHDIGRFRQLEIFGSYKDSNVDHALLGSSILFEEKLIDKLKINKENYEIIKFAIENHNKIKIENTNDQKLLMFTKIIRDADKIDILKYTINRGIKGQEDSVLSKEVIEQFMNCLPIDKKNINNKNDIVLLNLSLIYDINYDISFKIIKKDQLIEKFYESIINKKVFKSYFDIAFNYLKEREDEYVR